MDLSKQFVLPIVRHRLLGSALSDSTMQIPTASGTIHNFIAASFCACLHLLMLAYCFAGPFLRFGWDQAAVAFLLICISLSLLAVSRWAEHRHHRSMHPHRESRETLQS